MGLLPRCTFTRGPVGAARHPLIEIDPRPYRGDAVQAQGILERDQGVLAQAQMDLARYQAAWAKNAIPKQTLDDQEKLVAQDQGTVKNDQGTVQYDQIQVELLPHCGADYGAGRVAAGGSGQCGAGQRDARRWR